ncbi:MAG: M56 family metallopeptidase [Pirellulales bacterium]|nr:M56 family metallopeptidase [Pirellulales bacterium]
MMIDGVLTLGSTWHWEDWCIRWSITLAHFLWQGTLIALLATVIQRSGWLAESKQRYALGVLAMTAMLASVVVTFLSVNVDESSMLNWDRATAAAGIETLSQPAASEIEEESIAAGSPPTATDAFAPAASSVASKNSSAGSQVISATGAPIVDRQPIASGMFAWAPTVVTVYLLGVAALLFRTAAGFWGGRRLRAAATPLADPHLIKLVARQAKRLELGSVPVVAYCRRVSIPVVVGAIRPMILLPTSLATGLPADQLSLILSHELAHIRRFDPLVHLGQRLLESLLFFHPAVWWISRQISTERENCCDDLAVSSGCGRFEYVSALLSMAELCVDRLDKPRAAELAHLSALGQTPSQLSHRVHRLLRVSGHQRFLPSAGMLLALILALSVSVAGLAAFAGVGQTSPDSSATPQTSILLHGFDLAPYRSTKTWDQLRTSNPIFDRQRSVSSGGAWRCSVDAASMYSRWTVHYSPTESLFYVTDHSEAAPAVYGPVPGDAIAKLKLLTGQSDLVAAYDDAQNRRRAASLHRRRVTSLLESSDTQLLRYGLAALVELGDLEVSDLPRWAGSFDKITTGPINHERLKPWLDKAAAYLSEQRSRIESLKVAIEDEQYEPGRQPSQAERALPWGPAEGGLSLAVSPWPEQTLRVKPGDLLQFTYVVRNVSDSVRRISTLDVLDGVGADVVDQSTQQSVLLSFPSLSGIPRTQRYRLNPGEVAALKSFSVRITEGDFYPAEKKYSERNRDIVYGQLKLRREHRYQIDFRLALPSAYGQSNGSITLPARGEFEGQLKAPSLPMRLVANHNQQANNNQQAQDPKSDLADQDSSPPTTRVWKARLVNGLTDEPLVQIKVRANAAVPGQSELQPKTFTTDDEGFIQIPIHDGKATTIEVLEAGWWTSGLNFVGDGIYAKRVQRGEKGLTPPDPETPRIVKFYPGQKIAGRLLDPAGVPLAKGRLKVGVYLSNQNWKKRLGMNLTRHSWDHGDWPNWSTAVITDEQGVFQATVPPEEARSWVRVGTTELGFGAIPSSNPEAEEAGRVLAKYVPFEFQIGGVGGMTPVISPLDLTLDKDTLSFGDLQLQTGMMVHGRVVDVQGKGLAGVYLTTEGLHGPHSGRSAISGKNGEFKLGPVRDGTLIIRPDARLRDQRGKVISRDVQAVFVDQSYEVPLSDRPVELVVQAVPHVEVKFDWRDRRAKKGPVSYYGEFKMTGRFPLDDTRLGHWRGVTDLVDRDGQPQLVVKVPTGLLDATLWLSQDRVVTASYEDDAGRKAGPGQIPLPDFREARRRTIFGDDPIVKP